MRAGSPDSCGRPNVPPRTSAVAGRAVGTIRVQAQGHQTVLASERSLPLPPQVQRNRRRSHSSRRQPRALRHRAQIRPWSRRGNCGATFDFRLVVTVYPKNLRAQGRAMALLSRLIGRRWHLDRKLSSEVITRSPVRLDSPDQSHHLLVLHPVEETLQIQIHHPIIPGPDVFLAALYRFRQFLTDPVPLRLTIRPLLVNGYSVPGLSARAVFV